MAIEKRELGIQSNPEIRIQDNSVEVFPAPSRQDQIRDAAEILISEEDILIDDEISAEPEASASTITPERDFASLERNLGNWMDVEFIDPAYGGYWASDDDIPKFLSYGYKFAQPNQVKDFRLRFSDLNPGEGMSPGGAIKRSGLALLIAPKSLQERIEKHFYDKRPNVENRADFISPEELAAKQSTHY